MADEKEKTLTVDATDLEAWAKEKGVTPEALAELRERIDAKEVDRNRGRFWKHIMQVLGFTALIGAGVGAGVYVAHEAVEAMPETVAKVGEREWAERKVIAQERAEAAGQALKELSAKIGAFLAVLPSTLNNYEEVKSLLQTLASGAWADFSEKLNGGDATPDQTVKALGDFLNNDEALAPYWAAISGAYDDFKRKAEEFIELKGAFDVTDTDKAQAWDDYKKVLWGDIQEDFGGQSKKLPTSAPAPESPK